MAQNPECHLEGPINVKSGLLWHKKYARLCGSQLSLFKSKEDFLQGSSTKNCEQYDVTLAQTKEQDERGFAIVGPKLSRQLCLKTSTKSELLEWLEALRRLQTLEASKERTPTSIGPSPTTTYSGSSVAKIPETSNEASCQTPKPGMWPCSRCGAWNRRLAESCAMCDGGDNALRVARSTGNLSGRTRLATATSKGIVLSKSGPVDRSVRAFEDEVRSCGILLASGSNGSSETTTANDTQVATQQNNSIIPSEPKSATGT